jgi:hypothetical protein
MHIATANLGKAMPIAKESDIRKKLAATASMPVTWP